MATANTQTLVYGDWSFGEYGILSPSKAPPNSWTGNNVVVYSSGLIGPRPGVKLVDQGVPGHVGPMLGFGFSPAGAADDTPIFYIIGTHVYLFDPAGTASLVEASDTLDAPPPSSPSQSVLSKESVRFINEEVYFSIDGDKTYRLNCKTQVLTPIADSAEGTDIETYRDRMLVANGQRRIFFSDTADFSTWPVENFFDVGPSWRVINMTEFRDSLIIFTESGTWIMSGTADNGTLRRTTDSLPPQDKAVVKSIKDEVMDAYRMPNDFVYYVPASRSAPVSFNGNFGDEWLLHHLENWKSPGRICYGVQSYGNRDILFMADNSHLLWRKNNAWSYHTIAGNCGPWITRYFDDQVLLGTTGSVSDDPDFYMLAMNLNRPAFTSDTWAQPGDNSTTPLQADLTLPDYFDPAGRQVRVRQIIVDFIKYRTGSPTNNNMDLTVTSLARLRLAGDGSEPMTAAYNEAGSAVPVGSGGTRDRLVLDCGLSGYHGGFRVSLNNLRGVAIDRVCIDIETDEGRPRA